MIYMILFTANIVVFDFGATQDIRDYFNFEATKSQQEKVTVETVSNDIKSKFPMLSNLTVGRVTERRLTRKYQSMNLALIGDDSVSINWLKRNFKELQKHQTPIALVSVQSHKKYKKLQGIIAKAGLELTLLNADFMVNDIPNYPVLLIDGVMKQ